MLVEATARESSYYTIILYLGLDGGSGGEKERVPITCYTIILCLGLDGGSGGEKEC
jgi:hypothetical protein